MSPVRRTAPQIRLDVAVILKEGLDLAAHRVVGAEHLVRELLSRRGRRAVGSQPVLDLAPLVCGRTGVPGSTTCVERRHKGSGGKSEKP